MEDPATIAVAQGKLTAGAIIGASLINASVARWNTKSNIKAQKERDERLRELQERHFIENQQFQIERDKENRRFQLEMEAQRMSFQEHMELRRLQLQVRMEEQRERFQEALQSRQFEHSRELAQFQALAARETQILVSRENAKNTLGNQVVLEALKNFPLNISPMVLLNNRPHSLSALLRFTTNNHIEIEEKIDGEERKKLIGTNPMDVIQDVLSYAEQPEALNIFIAPVFVNSKMSYNKDLSTKIWEATYQKIESFFTRNYSRSGQRPVVFYPTAWNDKYTAGVHASETLHFFLKDLPCIVLEPKFDGNKFRMAISSWGLGYGATEHYRTEFELDVNVDLAIIESVYERSKNALEVIDIISNSTASVNDKRPYTDQYLPLYNKNIRMYEALRLGEFSSMDGGAKAKLLSQISALGIKNLFIIDESHDLEPLANYLSAQIGVTLAMLSDLHHLIATRVDPILPKLLESEEFFRGIYTSKEICEELFNSYKSTYAMIRDEECHLSSDYKESKRIYLSRIAEVQKIEEQLSHEDRPEKWQAIVREFVKDCHEYENDDFEKVWSTFIYKTDKPEISILKSILPLVMDEDKYDDLKQKIDNLS